jgi:hypothetical protein
VAAVTDAAEQRGSIRRKGRAPGAQRRGGWIAAAVALAACAAVPVSAEEATRQQMQSLDEQVQEMKSDVLGIAAELDRLEERLLYPSDTPGRGVRLAQAGETIRLDSVSVQIDGAPVARHIYSVKELEALQKGGVQRLYTGNVATGDHRLEVAMAGKLASGADFARTQTFAFSKKVERSWWDSRWRDAGDASIQLGAW